MDTRLQEIIENTRRAHARTVQASTPAEDMGSDNDGFEPSRKSIWRFDPLAPSLYYGPSDESMYLPPLEVS